MAKINFGGVEETVVTRDEFPLDKAREVLADETIAVIGYGVQGPAQALNMRDNGLNVIVGCRTKDRAIEDGWVPGETLFDIGEACERGTIVMILVSDAGQKAIWPDIQQYLTDGKAVCFSHGFAVAFKEQMGVIPADNIDVILVAPKGSGLNVRRNFLNGAGINSSYAVFQDVTGNAEQRCIALGIAVGSGFLFPTTFENEVFSDLTGERGILMGALCGVMEAQYDVLRANGHSPSEAFNETVEELTQSLIRLVDENGMDWMYANCSTTAQRGALDWRPKFKAATLPVFEDLYHSVKTGKETERVLNTCSGPDYKEHLAKELEEMAASEMWATGKAVRELRPNEEARESTVGTGGRTMND